MRAGVVISLVGWISVGACETAPSNPASTVVRRDSAGVEIVTIGFLPERPVFGPPELLLRLGSLDGPLTEQFSGIAAVVPLDDGGLLVADRTAHDLRFFAADGHHRVTVGGDGEGPGEFRSLATAAVFGDDSIAAFDWHTARVTVFDLDGELVRVFSLDVEPLGQPFRVTFRADGRILGQSRWLQPANSPPAEDLTFRRDSLVLRWYDRDGAAGDTLAVVPDREILRSIRQAEGAVIVKSSSAPFGRSSFVAQASDGVWIATNDRFELGLYGTDGTLRRILRAPGLERELTTDEVAAYRAQRLAEAETPAARREVSDLLELARLPRLWPAFSGLVVDDADRLWITEYTLDEQAPARAWVFAPGGELLGRVTFPRPLRLTAVHGERAFAVARDELGVAYVLVYGLSGLTEPAEAPAH